MAFPPKVPGSKPMGSQMHKAKVHPGFRKIAQKEAPKHLPIMGGMPGGAPMPEGTPMPPPPGGMEGEGC